MRTLVVLAFVVVAVSAQGYPMGGGYYGGAGGMEGGYGGSGYESAGGAGGGVMDHASSGYRRIEEGHNTRTFGANNNAGFMNRGRNGYGYNRGGGGMYGGYGVGGMPMI